MNMSTPFFTSEADPPARRRILVEALALFTRKGLGETTIRDIAAVTGYTNPALYKHFAGKEELALHLFVRCYEELWTRLARALEAESEAASRPGRFVRAFLALYDEHPEAVLYVNAHLAHFWPRVPEDLRRRTLVTLAGEMVRAARPGGRGREADVLAAGVLGFLTQVARMVYLGGLPAPASAHAEIIEGALRRMLA